VCPTTSTGCATRRTDVFFANKRPGYLERNGLTAEELCATKPGLIHAKVVLHGDTVPGRTVPASMRSAQPYRACSVSKGRLPFPNRRRLFRFATTWWACSGRWAYSRRCAGVGGPQLSSRRVSDRTVLWLLSLGIFRQGVRSSYGRIERRAHVCRSRLFTADSAGHLPGNDRPGGRVANERVIPNGPGAARLVETAMATTVNWISNLLRQPWRTHSGQRKSDSADVAETLGEQHRRAATQPHH